ncbi:MBL fold metallo-hydrolase [bacterium]|nr:MBL fold metallo-hydrolase [bacterium]
MNCELLFGRAKTVISKEKMSFRLPLRPLFIVTVLLSATVAPADEKTGTLDVYWPDVEGGAATLIVTPVGETILVDSGNPGERDAARIVKLARDVAGRKQIDHLVTTHFHTDHFGGAAQVARQLPIINIWDNGAPDTNPDGNKNDARFPIMIKPYKEIPAKERHIMKPDDELPLKQLSIFNQVTKAKESGNNETFKHVFNTPLTVRCLAAKQHFSTKVIRSKSPVDCASVPAKEADTSDNRNSVVLLLSFGDFRFFMGGDLTWNDEAKLVCPHDLVGPVDVYQVTHHGLDASNNPLVVQTLAPTVSVMSNGTQKGCGAQTFATLKATPSIKAMFQIHKNLRQDSENNTADEYIANLEKDCAANYIKMTVAPDGESYTIAIPAKGHSREFKTVTK